MAVFIYIVGLVIALAFVLFSIDDVIWDLAYTFNRKLHRNAVLVPWGSLDARPPRLIAVIIVAWHEDAVIESVIDHMHASVHYPRSLYHVFLGVYPNDPPTIDAAGRLAQRYGNVHVSVNPNQGPTSKADNINQTIEYIREFERSMGWEFKSVTIHDSEDVVHPYEYKLTSYLLDEYDVLQFPVFPLQKIPTPSNILSGLTTGTYADEFAENHYRAMNIRERMSAVVPSAGTGFALSHTVLEKHRGDKLFPENSLTEDYRLSLLLQQEGFHTHYVFEKVLRLEDDGKTRWDYVATRSLFPSTFETAVRQKTRWIYGITMQSSKLSDIFSKDDGLSVSGKYTLYKDMKAKIGNLLILPGYIIFVYFLASFFFDLPVVYPAYTFSWWLCALLTVMMVVRQVTRAIAIGNVYGFRSVVVACLLPPLMPVRLVWGNIINLCATLCAWKQFLLKPRKKRGGKVVWNKTDHEFLSRRVLSRYYRNVGDELLERQVIDSDILRSALSSSKEMQVRLGEVLLREGRITEDQLMSAVASVQHGVLVNNLDAFANDDGNHRFDAGLLEQLLVFPLMEVNGYAVMVQTNETPSDAYRTLGLDPAEVRVAYATREHVVEAIRRGPMRPSQSYRAIMELLRVDKILWEQAVIALDNQGLSPDILGYMGLRPPTSPMGAVEDS